MRVLACIVVITLIGCTSRSSEQVDALPEVVDYNFHIRPILSDRCYACHGPDGNARQAGLRLDEEYGAKYARLESGGHAIVPKNPRKSRLYGRITALDPEVRMPPLESNLVLDSREIALIERWILQGAEWKPHWSFIPVETPQRPDVSAVEWPRNDLDYFVLSHLEREGFTPSPEAERATLLRRVTFDLTGLPPTLAEIDAFLADTSVGAYERVVDHLLASPAYGEHMAAEWLDVARYADTHGYQADRERRMWPWRDWVIEAFNSNLPFDEFGTWQIAGDLLPNATEAQRLATAFNRNHRQTNEGGSIEEEFRTEYVADRTNTMGTAFMGLALECARCHDHKYDPISQADYYGLFSFFNNIDESGQTSHFTDAVPVPAMALPQPDTERTIDSLRMDIAATERSLATLAVVANPTFERWRVNLDRLPEEHDRGLVLECNFEYLEPEQIFCESGQQGTLVFAPERAPGHDGNGLSFDGESGIYFEGVGEFRRTDPFSISVWIKPAEETGILVHHSQAALDAGSRGYELALHDGHLIAQLAHMWPENAIRIRTHESVSMNEWTHLALTYDGLSQASGLHLYVNGKQAEVEVIRDALTRNITYENLAVHLALAYRFRDTGFRDGTMDKLRIYDRALAAFEVAQLAGLKLGAAEDEDLFAWYLARHEAPWIRARHTLQSLLEKENTLVSDVPEIMVMREMPMPRTAHILMRGQYDAKGAAVSPRAPEVILPFPDTFPANRYGLAQWLFHPQHPLSARVAVNRYWQRYFGTGIVATPEDFGRQGALPSHPELLDYLAHTFVATGWNVKAMQRLIVTSATYRQHSDAPPHLTARDPDNRLLARGPRLRLTAEMIRDQALVAGALLDRTMGGPAVKPYQPAGLWEEKSGVRYQQDTGNALYRRTLYTFFKRTSPPPSLATFDMPTRSQCVMRRQRTATPMQALVLLNDPQYVEAARHIAVRMLSEPSLDEQLAKGFRLLTGRPPELDELGILRTLFAEQHASFMRDPAAARLLLSTGDSPADDHDDDPVWAAHAMVASAILSFDEAVLKY